MNLPSAARALGAILTVLSIAPAQSWRPMHGLPLSVRAGVFDPQRQRPIVVERTATGSVPWEFDGAAWTRRAGEAALAATDPVLVADTRRGRVLAFAASPLPSAAAYDGVRWQPLPGATALRQGAAVTFDPVRDRVLAFGGRTPTTAANGLLAYDGASWAAVPIAGAWPAARTDAAFAFDAVRGRAVLFGGEDAAFTRLGDTWEWDGAAWTPFAGAGPSPRSLAAMVFDPLLQTLVLVGGADPIGLVLAAEAHGRHQSSVVLHP